MNSQTNIHFNATGVGNKDSFNVINNYNNTYVEDKSQVLEWLSPLEPRVRHQDVRTNRVDGVGGWFLESEEFVNWRDGKGGSSRSILFCSGAPGVGKTYLSSLVIDTLCDQSVGRKVAVACFWCDFQYQKTQTPENILGALIKQLIRGLGVIPIEVGNAFRKAEGQVGGRGLRVHELLPLLRATLSPLERAFICIDALDECLGKHLPELLRSLHAISQWSPKIRLFITGRPHISREIEKHFPGGAQLVEIKPTTEDIMKYLQTMLDNDPDPEAMNADFRAEIVKRVLETISDVFLLVSLNIAAVLAEATIYDRREQLKRMTNGLGLGNAYRVALDRMETQGGARSRLGMATLMWISRSERPMTADELCHALGVQIGSTDLNPETIPSIQTLLASCHGLVTIDKVGSTVRLVHLTLQEYLDSHPEIFPLSYAAGYGNERAVKLLLEQEDINAESRDDCGTTPLSYAAGSGNQGAVKLLLEREGVNPESLDNYGRTPLSYATRYGNGEAVKVLLQLEMVNPESRDNSGRTPLSYAAESGNEGVVKLFLERELVNAESRDNNGRTPLSYAAGCLDGRTVQLFLEREEVNPESQDNDGKTPLFYALKNGSKEIVKILLELREVNFRSGALPEDEEVARLLREWFDTLPITPDPESRAPNSPRDTDGREAELLELPLQLQDSTQDFPPVTFVLDNPYQIPKAPTGNPTLYPHTLSRAHSVPLSAAATGSLEPSPQPPRRRFSLAFGDEPLAHNSPKRRKSS